jgi:hypothetical protein
MLDGVSSMLSILLLIVGGKSAHIACNPLPIDDDLSIHADRPVLGAQSLTGLGKRKARGYAARLVGLGFRGEVIDTVAQF